MTKRLRSLKEGILWKTMSTGISAFAGFVMSIIFARFLGKDDYGRLILVFTVVSLFAVMSNFGLNAALQRFIPLYINKKETEKFAKFIVTTAILGSCLTVFFSVVMFLASHIISVNILHNPSLVIYMKWGALYLFTISILTNIVLSFYYGFEKWKGECLLTVFYLTIYVLGTIVALRIFKDGIICVINTAALSCLIGIIAGLLGIKRHLGSVKPVLKIGESILEMKETLDFSTPVFINGLLFYLIIYLDKIILGRCRSPAELSQYYVAFAIGTAIIMFLKVAEVVFTPYLAKLTDEKEIILKEKFQIIFQFFLHSSVFISIITYFLTDPFINLVYGKNFEIASKALKIYLVTIVLRSAMAPVTLFITNVYGKTIEITKICLVNVLAHIGLYLVLIPQYGYTGAMIATILATSLTWFYIVLFVKEINRLIPYKSILCAGMGVSIVFAVYFAMRFYNIYNRPLFLMLFPLIYLLFALSKDNIDIRKIKNAI